MALTLKPVEPARGVRWVRDGFTLFARRPLAFAAMFVAYMFVVLILALLPLAGALLQMATLPLLSLGFMVAGQSALLGGGVHPGQFFEPLRGSPQKRRALITLCLIFGACALAILLVCDMLSAGAMQRMQAVMAGGGKQAELDAILAEPGVSQAVISGMVLASLLSVPFWHAPALVHWGGQGALQALFSSTLALWRCKGAFLVYGLAWLALTVVAGVISAQALLLFGAGRGGYFLLMAMSLLLTTVFYVSLLFPFNDSFGGGAAPPPDSDAGNSLNAG